MTQILAGNTARTAFAGVLLVMGTDCASKPVEVTTAAIVSLDTTRRVAARARKSALPRSFWAAMTNLDPDYVATHPVSQDEREFAGALRMVMSGAPDEAELVLDSLARHAADSVVRSASHILLTAALQYQDKWKELAEISLGRSVAGDSADIDRASVDLWASAFKDVPRRAVDFPVAAVVIPLTLSAAGTPMIPVQINGKLKHFWLDTGSSMSIIASDVAAECGVGPLVSDTLEVATTTGRVRARPAAIQKLDGIIGFDIISRLNVQVDYSKGRVRLSKPVRMAGAASQRNFFWVGTPVVRLASQTGVPLHLGLDTGAQETFATEQLLDKIRVRTVVGERKRVGGFAGLREFRGRFIPDVRLALRGKTLLFQNLLVFVPLVSTFVTLDGVLGSDIGRTGVVQIDAVNGVFSIEASR